MAFLGIRNGSAPRLAPELDDVELSRVRRRLTQSTGRPTNDLNISVIEQLLTDSRHDPDRHCHRLVVLAEAVPPSLPRHWLGQQPHNPDAQLLATWAAVIEAHETGRVQDPRALADACAKAAEHNPAHASPWVALLAVQRVLRRPTEDLSRVWHEIGRRAPWNREAHLQLIGYLSPQECGSRAQVLDFVEGVRATAPAGAPVAGLELVALVDLFQYSLAKGGVTELTAAHQWEWPNAIAALDRALADWTRPGFLTYAGALADLNVLAYALVQARRAAQADEVFRTLGGCVSAWPWGYDGRDPVQAFEAGARTARRQAR
jgi:hypothetical protein